MALASNGGGGGIPPELKALISAGGSGSSGGGQVYMGQTYRGVSRGGGRFMSEAAQAQVQRRKVDVWVSTQEAYEDYSHWSAKKRRDFIGAGIVGGKLKLGAGDLEARKLWEDLVDAAAKYGKAGQKVQPWDILASYVSAAGGGKGTWVKQGDFEINTVTGGRRYIGPRFKTQTDTRVDLTDPDTARAIATKLFQDMMGRDPQAGELKGFATALHTAEESSPVTQTTTTEYNMKTGEPIGSNTTSTGGMTAEGRAYIGEQQIKKKKEYGVTQAVTTYQNALENLIYGAPE